MSFVEGGVRPAIYHRDIKANNILLDEDMNACVADFGLARMASEGESYIVSKVSGTRGYLAPEYALYGILTDRSDVYSLGVVLLEIMSGRKPLDTSVECSSEYLIIDWAWKLLETNRVVHEVIDWRMRESEEVKRMERFVKVGILCTDVNVALRPSIEDVGRRGCHSRNTREAFSCSESQSGEQWKGVSERCRELSFLNQLVCHWKIGGTRNPRWSNT